jgi:DNA-binding transcriptional LysR family regulator
MDARALRYFIKVVQEDSFTRAADALFVTQPAISKMVRLLEEEVGQPLLVRADRHVRLTVAGRIVFERGQEMLGILNKLKGELEDVAQLKRGTLNVGIPPMVNLFFSPVVATFHARYPGVTLRLHEGGGHAIEKQILLGELEIGATILPVESVKLLATRPFGAHIMYAICRSDAPLAQHETVSLAGLCDVPLVLFNDDFATTAAIRAAFRQAGLKPTISTQSAQWDFLLAMVAAGLGVALLPEPLCRRLDPGALVAIRVIAPEIQWQVAHIWQQDGHLSHAARAWLDICEELLPAISM